MPAARISSPEFLPASGRSSEKQLGLSSLQSKMKSDPDGYLSELHLVLRRFDSSLDLFRRHSSLSTSTTDPIVSKEFGDFAMFLAHVASFYPGHVDEFPGKVVGLLMEDGRSLPPSLRCHLVQALVILANRKVVGIEETLQVFMHLQTLGDRTLRKLAFSHVVHSIRRMNQKHKNEAENRKLQNILFCCYRERTRRRPKEHLLFFVIFIEEKCGLMIGRPMPYVLHVSIRLLGF
ncbi:protein SDA1-like protein [Iris pallida]|uniref:Protein SDA1 n=1 Tax=Iris pallida TaxID=29817 RepID=A0AAX6F0N6_IRIPA|nr:protein SDA1-like protein [Iris pallida]